MKYKHIRKRKLEMKILRIWRYIYTKSNKFIVQDRENFNIIRCLQTYYLLFQRDTTIEHSYIILLCKLFQRSTSHNNISI